MTQQFIQPADNEFADEVYQDLMRLAASFRERMYFSIADELEMIAQRGPAGMLTEQKNTVLNQIQAVEHSLANLRASLS
jgi:hypothetical protein